MRPPAIRPEHGVRHVMKSLLADFDILMNVGGFQNVEQMMDRSVLGTYLLSALGHGRLLIVGGQNRIRRLMR